MLVASIARKDRHPTPPPPMEGKEIQRGEGGRGGSERTQFLRGWDFSLFTAETINFRIIV